ncbi:MAG: MFS transporter [Promethearchaeota archaeon]
MNDKRERLVEIERSVRTMYMINVLRGLEFSMPIIVLYFLQFVKTALNLSHIITTWAIGTIIFEFPSGVIADRWGRKKTIMLSNGLACSSVAIILLLPGSLATFIFFEIISSLSDSLLSGTDTALLYDLVLEHNKMAGDSTIDFKKITGRNKSMWPIGAMISGIAGGLMALHSYSRPILLTLVPFGLAIGVGTRLVEPSVTTQEGTSLKQHLKNSFSSISKNKVILAIFTIGFITFATGEITHQFNQLLFADRMVPIEFFGLLVTLGFGLSAFGSWISHVLTKKADIRVILAISIFFSAITSISSTFLQGLVSGLVFTSSSIFWGISQPIWDDFMNKNVGSSNRATIISMANFINFMGLALVSPPFGLLVDAMGIRWLVRITPLAGLIKLIILIFMKGDQLKADVTR